VKLPAEEVFNFLFPHLVRSRVYCDAVRSKHTPLHEHEQDNQAPEKTRGEGSGGCPESNRCLCHPAHSPFEPKADVMKKKRKKKE
jgi:hypothetical protein